MNLKTLAILALVTAALVGAAYLAVKKGTPAASTGREEAAQEALFPNLRDRIDEVDLVSIQTAEDSFEVRREDGKWRLPGEHNYWADSEKAEGVVASLAAARTVEKKTGNPDWHKRLGVEDPDAEESTSALVTLSAGDQQVASLIVGQGAGQRRGQNAIYARKPGDDQAWLVETPLSLTRSPAAWTDKIVADIPADSVRSMRIEPDTGGAVELGGALKPGDSLDIENVPEGREVANRSDISSVARSFEGLRHNQVLPAAEAPDNLTSETLVRVATFDGLVLKASIKAEGETKFWGTFSAQYDPAERLQPEEPATEEAATEDGEPILPAPKPEIASEDEVRQQVEDLNAKVSGWVYEIPSWKARTLRKSLDELTKDAEKKVTARHILVGYEGASRSEVTGRTREEAEALARQIREEVLADPSRFAEIAREKSDGPSAPQGGDLGEFGPGVMAKAFEDAAFNLEVDGVSDVVETEFGFHIIQRTK